eukprot:6196462-Heterocapsa_arctica.AAC.1
MPRHGRTSTDGSTPTGGVMYRLTIARSLSCCSRLTATSAGSASLGAGSHPRDRVIGLNGQVVDVRQQYAN